ncbi:hypothetical protein Csa_022948, partial [Cucumis sativus]
NVSKSEENNTRSASGSPSGKVLWKGKTESDCMFTNNVEHASAKVSEAKCKTRSTKSTENSFVSDENPFVSEATL